MRSNRGIEVIKKINVHSGPPETIITSARRAQHMSISILKVVPVWASDETQVKKIKILLPVPRDLHVRANRGNTEAA